MRNRLQQWLGKEEPHYGKLWFLFFLYPAFVALAVQFIVVPYLFPNLNTGDGLLKGYDFVQFHQLAVSMSQNIRVDGWAAWELRPEGQAPAGIAALFYALFLPKPWVLIPLNAALHATSVLLLILNLNFFTKKPNISLLAAIPFWLYPSAATWYAQIHKDGYFIAGFLMFLYGWNLLLQKEPGAFLKRISSAGLLIAAGIFLIWIVRPYALQMLQGLGLAAALGCAFLYAIRAFKRIVPWTQAALSITLLGLILLGFIPALRSIPVRTGEGVGLKHVVAWRDTFWLGAIENLAYNLAVTREGYRLDYPLAGSNVDVDVSFHSVNEILFYLPRAFELGFLAPFPADWFKPGTQESRTLERRIAGMEMAGVYVGLVFLIPSLWKWRRFPELWTTFFFSSGMLVIYAIVTANIGTLYRFRYGFIMTIVAIGLAGGVKTLQEWKIQQKR